MARCIQPEAYPGAHNTQAPRGVWQPLGRKRRSITSGSNDVLAALFYALVTTKDRICQPCLKSVGVRHKC